jgi:hypothetical protein
MKKLIALVFITTCLFNSIAISETVCIEWEEGACAFPSIEEWVQIQTVLQTNNIVDDSLDPGKSNDQEKIEDGEFAIGFAIRQISEDISVYHLPWSYALTSYLRLEGEFPYIKTEKEESWGNSLVSLQLGEKYFSVDIGGWIHNGSEKLGNRHVSDSKYGANLAIDIFNIRVFGSYHQIIRPVDDSEFDPGDSVYILMGFDLPLPFIGSETGLYCSQLQRNTVEDQVDGAAMGNALQIEDIVMGFVIRNWNIRFGAIIPTKTQSEDDSVDHEKRKTGFDLGVRYYL